MEEEEREGRRRFTTTMQSSVGMKQSCTCGERNRLFPVIEEEKEEKDMEVEEEHKDEEKEEEKVVVRRRKRSQLRCNLLQQCSGVLLVAKAIVSFQ